MSSHPTEGPIETMEEMRARVKREIAEKIQREKAEEKVRQENLALIQLKKQQLEEKQAKIDAEKGRQAEQRRQAEQARKDAEDKFRQETEEEMRKQAAGRGI